MHPLARASRPNLSLAEARLQAAIKQYEETWAYYQQARIDSYQVYVWSRFVLDCRRDIAESQPSDRRLEDHLGRMKKLEALIIKKVRRLGFGRSYDVGASRSTTGSRPSSGWSGTRKEVNRRPVVQGCPLHLIVRIDGTRFA